MKRKESKAKKIAPQPGRMPMKEIRKAIRIMRKNKVKPARCPTCGGDVYILDEQRGRRFINAPKTQSP